MQLVTWTAVTSFRKLSVFLPFFFSALTWRFNDIQRWMPRCIPNSDARGLEVFLYVSTLSSQSQLSHWHHASWCMSSGFSIIQSSRGRILRLFWVSVKRCSSVVLAAAATIVQLISDRQCCLLILNCHVKCYVRSLWAFFVFTTEIDKFCLRTASGIIFKVIVHKL